MPALGVSRDLHLWATRSYSLFVNGVEMVSNLLVHAEHVDSRLLKNSLHLGVTSDLAFVAGVLEVVGLDVVP